MRPTEEIALHALPQCEVAFELAFEARRGCAASIRRAPDLEKCAIFCGLLLLTHLADGYSIRIIVNQLAARLAQPHPVFGACSLLLVQRWIVAWAALRRRGDVCRHANV
jgi:hypothetical protein